MLNQFFAGAKLARKSSRPGVTTTIDFYNIDNKVVFVDTPGYGDNLNPRARRGWEQMLKEYLRNSKNLRMVCLLMDVTVLPTEDDISLVKLIGQRTSAAARKQNKAKREQGNESDSRGRIHDIMLGLQDRENTEPTPEALVKLQEAAVVRERERLAAAAADTAEDIAEGAIPVLLVLTKDDKVTHDQRQKLLHRISKRLQWKGPHLHYSIKDRRGRGHLLRHVMTTLYKPEESALLKELAFRQSASPEVQAVHDKRVNTRKANQRKLAKPEWQKKQRADTLARQARREEQERAAAEAEAAGEPIPAGKKKRKKNRAPVELTHTTDFD